MNAKTPKTSGQDTMAPSPRHLWAASQQPEACALRGLSGLSQQDQRMLPCKQNRKVYDTNRKKNKLFKNTVSWIKNGKNKHEENHRKPAVPNSVGLDMFRFRAFLGKTNMILYKQTKSQRLPGTPRIVQLW